MENLQKINNPYGEGKILEGCGIFGMMDTSGKRFSGADIRKAIANMHQRSNGLGGGLAAYGIYPDFADLYAFHVMYLNPESQSVVEEFLKTKFHMVQAEEVPTRPVKTIVNPPVIWRYFLDARPDKCGEKPSDDYVLDRVMEINTGMKDAFVFSSGKNMGVFKGVGYPEDIADFFCLDQYKGYLWTAHGRFPTNTRGWWGGAHPFSVLDWTVVHNGEISSYGTNQRFIEQFGYVCTMQTDTEVVAYTVDLLVRKHGLPIEIAARVMAAPFWNEIERMPKDERELTSALRQVYSSLLLNGPFTFVLAHTGEMIGLTDRIRLRPLTVGLKGDMVYLSSEEASIRLICPDLDSAFIPMGGEPIIAKLGVPFQEKYPSLVGAKA